MGGGSTGVIHVLYGVCKWGQDSTGIMHVLYGSVHGEGHYRVFSRDP